MTTYGNYDSIPLSIPVTLDGQPIDLSAYDPNAAIDGTKGSPLFKIQVTVHKSSDNSLLTTSDNIPCDRLTTFRSSNTAVKNIAVLTLRKGFLVTEDTEMYAIAWYDSTSGGSDGWRKCGRTDFQVTLFAGGITPPY